MASLTISKLILCLYELLADYTYREQKYFTILQHVNLQDGSHQVWSNNDKTAEASIFYLPRVKNHGNTQCSLTGTVGSCPIASPNLYGNLIPHAQNIQMKTVPSAYTTLALCVTRHLPVESRHLHSLLIPPHLRMCQMAITRKGSQDPLTQISYSLTSFRCSDWVHMESPWLLTSSFTWHCRQRGGTP